MQHSCLEDITPGEFLAVYDSICELGAASEKIAAMRKVFESRTGAFRPEDPWFEVRSRAFWDDALTTQQFAKVAPLPPSNSASANFAKYAGALAEPLAMSHRGLFVAEDVDGRGARMVDLWSGAEFLVRHVDEAQAIAFEHAEGLIDARVVALGSLFMLLVLPGAFHHPPDAREPIERVVNEARQRRLSTGAVLDALLRMELIFRSSSRVKASFAYRIDHLPPLSI
ncbi:MAG: hypothetical protein FWD73_04570 [Polyangiaceae bacterium]|nr:hypothetical protein [Polyangiaceae bacterium]